MDVARDTAQIVVDTLRAAAGATAAGSIELTGPEQVLPSVFDVTGFAAGTVAAAVSAAADLLAARTGVAPRPVRVDRHDAAAAFVCELLFTPDGWERPAPWDPIAGDYPCADGWIRLHTNYRTHRTAALAALGVADRPELDRAALAPCVAERSGDELEQSVVDAGGCAAAMRDRDAWARHPAGVAALGARLVEVRRRAGAAGPLAPGARRPLDGVRVLDLTRVIAGPVCTRFLAAHGADVLRIDPVGFEEVGALLPITTAGKHVAALDLHDAGDLAHFESLVAQADVIVSGLRPDALDRLGLGPDRLASINPAIITARLDAYGWSGPWAQRRGFDSLVQMSTGIAAEGQRISGAPGPRPLPAQALDHGTGYLLAAAVCHALASRVTDGTAADITGSLAATVALLTRFPTPDGLAVPPPTWRADVNAPVVTHWGTARAVPVPGAIDGVPIAQLRDARPLASDPPTFP